MRIHDKYAFLNGTKLCKWSETKYLQGVVSTQSWMQLTRNLIPGGWLFEEEELCILRMTGAFLKHRSKLDLTEKFSSALTKTGVGEKKKHQKKNWNVKNIIIIIDQANIVDFNRI